MSYIYATLGVLIALIPAGGGVWIIGRMRTGRYELSYPFNRTRNIGRWLVALGLMAISAIILVGSIHAATKFGQLVEDLNGISQGVADVQQTELAPVIDTAEIPLEGDTYTPDCTNLDVLDQYDYAYCTAGE